MIELLVVAVVIAGVALLAYKSKGKTAEVKEAVKPAKQTKVAKDKPAPKKAKSKKLTRKTTNKEK
jgi:hypothetical protein